MKVQQVWSGSEAVESALFDLAESCAWAREDSAEESTHGCSKYLIFLLLLIDDGIVQGQTSRLSAMGLGFRVVKCFKL